MLTGRDGRDGPWRRDRLHSRGRAAWVIATAPAGTGPHGRTPASQGLVRCRVASDPEWVEYRLITRRQCRAVNGVHLPPR
jgi:hypothetical protein